MPFAYMGISVLAVKSILRAASLTSVVSGVTSHLAAQGLNLGMHPFITYLSVYLIFLNEILVSRLFLCSVVKASRLADLKFASALLDD